MKEAGVMSFFDEARALHQNAHSQKQQTQTQRENVAKQIINRHFLTLEKELYQDLRKKALASYADAGSLSDLDYHKQWIISMDFLQYDSDIVESHIKQCMESAFMRLVDELSGRDRLKKYHKPGKYCGQDISGYRIYTFRHSPSTRNDSDWSPYPGRFEVTLNSRFTPPLN